MLPIAGQTAGPNGLTFFVDTHGWSVDFLGQKNEFVINFFLSIFYFKFLFSTGNPGPFS